MDGIHISTISLTLLVSLSVFIYTKIVHRWHVSSEVELQSSPRLFSDHRICKRILACQGIDENGIEYGISPLESRAIPNQRLVQAFQIDNAFTTTSQMYLKEFKNSATLKFSKLGPQQWKRSGEVANMLVRRAIEKATWTDSSETDTRVIDLTSFVQAFTFKMSLYFLYGSRPLDLEDRPIQKITSTINHIWIRSKRVHDSNALQSDRQSLMAYLQDVLPHVRETSKDNPLNFILPAYETLWRVVFLCLLEVLFRNGDDTAAASWREVLVRFLNDPTDYQFKQMIEDPSENSLPVSASFLVNEALRLYPPTKRIYRYLHLKGREKPELLAADIEKCQRNKIVWGQDSLAFNPSRWKDLCGEGHRSFMPFGDQPFTCPARQNFGPWMIGLLVAALATNFDRGVWKYAIHDKDARFEPNEPLRSERDAYAGLTISRRCN